MTELHEEFSVPEPRDRLRSSRTSAISDKTAVSQKRERRSTNAAARFTATLPIAGRENFLPGKDAPLDRRLPGQCLRRWARPLRYARTPVVQLRFASADE